MARPHDHDVFVWFRNRYGRPTAPQQAAWPLIRARKNVLVAAPTGTGKTFAAFLGVLDRLEHLHRHNQLLETIYCIYVSPMRALAYDLEKNLNAPLREIFGCNSPLRVAMRTGDTTQSERRRQFEHPPHILLTTPESLCVLLSQRRWLPHLANVRWLIIDEIHALAENKRGAHLSLSIERLDYLVSGSALRPATRLQRIGLSATVAPMEEVGRYLSGMRGECELVDVAAARKLDLRVYTPLRRDPYPEAGYTGQRLIRELAALVRKNRTTLVFTNTRSGAEAATFWLKEAAPDLADRIECHHASLERDVRQNVEDRLKRGELRAVVCSTSLELGIDIGSIDLVVMLSTPKGVSKALQRTGRSGHNIHSTSRGVLMATNVNDLVESCATALLGRQYHLDSVRIPEAPLDVLAQHLVSMGCEGPWKRKEAFELVRRAQPYATLSRKNFDDVLDYLAGGGKALRAQYSEVFGKIELDDESFRTRPGRVQRDFLENIGVIPNVGVVRVRIGSRYLGSVEESFIDQLQPGDIFLLAGRAVRLERHGIMEAFVVPANGALPTVPRWNANKMPLSANVAEAIRKFRAELRTRFEAGELDTSIPWIADRFDCGKANARIIYEMYRSQHELSEIPTGDALLIEEFCTGPVDLPGAHPRKGARKEPSPGGAARHYFVHSLIGRAANDALARVITWRLSRLRGGNAIATPHDYGFVLTVAPDQMFTEGDLPKLLAPAEFLEDFHRALAGSEMLKHHFRNAAQTGLMVYRNYFGNQKPARKLQWSSEVLFNVLRQHEPDHVLLREARKDCMHVFLDAQAAASFAAEAICQPVRIRRVDRVPPLSFAMYATRIREALVVEDPAETMERLFNMWWKEIERGSEAA